MFPASKKGSGGAPAFPDVCKTPAPPAPFVPVPYPNTAYQSNLQAAQKVDIQARLGNAKAKAMQQKAISNLKKSVGDEAGTLKGVTSAATAVTIGYTLTVNGIGRPAPGRGTAIEMGLRAAPSQTRVIVGN